MADQTQQVRLVRAQTSSGMIEGSLLVTPRLRTLDHISTVARVFLTLHGPKLIEGSWDLAGGPLTLSKASVFFVTESTPPPPRPANLPSRFGQACLRIRVGPYDVEGYVHFPQGGEPMKRLDQDHHGFLALTSALVAGPSGEFTTSFLAVNRTHIVGAQLLGQPEAPAAVPVTAGEIDD